MSKPAVTPDTLDPHAACRSLGLPPAAADAPWAEGWSPHRRWQPRCFDAAFIEAVCREIHMSDTTLACLIDGLEALSQSPALRAIISHLCTRLYHSDLSTQDKRRITATCPAPPPSASLMQAYVVIEGMADVVAAQQRDGWDPTVIRDTWYDLELWINRYTQRTGHVGFDHIAWLTNHLTGNLVRLGRLQFCPDRVPPHVRGYRHRATRRVVVVSEPGHRYRGDGQHDGANGEHDPGAWTSTFERRNGHIIANPFSPYGAAQPQTVELAEGEWDEIITPQAPSMGIHIPADGPMGFDACGESLRMAAAQFDRYIPGHGAKVFTCNSWLCDPQFGELLPPTSNIRKLQSQFYLVPLPGASESSLFMQLFGRTFDSLDDIPQDNTLFRTIVAHKRAGNKWLRGGALLHVDDLDWGGPGYRDQSNNAT